MTLKEAVDAAIKQNPDMVLARLDEQRAQASIRIAKDPFAPKVFAGSGLAYTNGYPNSINGSAPSIVEVQTVMSLFNRPKAYELAEARENTRGAAIDSASKADEVVYRTAALFLDAERTSRDAKSLQLEVESMEHVREIVGVLFREGRQLPIDLKRADLDVARARQRHQAVVDDQDYAEASLAVVLGLPAEDRIHAAEDDPIESPMPSNEQACVELALNNSKEVRRLHSQMIAKGFEERSQKAQRLPQVDLIAQYALFAKYYYEDYFKRFQSNNGQLGIAIKLPLLIGSAAAGLQAQADVDLAKLRTQLNDARNRAALEARKSYQDVQRAETARDVAKLDLDVAREQVSVLLTQFDEGRATRQVIDQARMVEQEKWIGFYETQTALDKAKLALLRQTGTIVAALR